jgi:hypothetical protein
MLIWAATALRAVFGREAIDTGSGRQTSNGKFDDAELSFSFGVLTCGEPT